MSTTNSRGLILPTVGGDTAAWGGYLNNDLGYITQMFGTVLEISVTSGATLTTTQTQNGVIRFTGTLTSNVDVSFPNVSGVWQIDNRTTGNYYVRVKTATGANQTIGLPQGVVTPIRVESGTDGGVTSYPGVSFVNSPLPGTYWDYGSGTTPAWFGGCTSDGTTAQLPWIVCDGSTYNITSYPYLGAILGSTFGGNGVTTFGVPDLRNRARVSVMSSGARLTSAVSGIDGTVVGSGGSTLESTTLSTSQIPAHQHNVYLYDPTHAHTQLTNNNGRKVQGGSDYAFYDAPGTLTSYSSTGITIGSTSGAGANDNKTANAGGGTAHTNVQPTIVAGLTFIKT